MNTDDLVLRERLLDDLFLSIGELKKIRVERDIYRASLNAIVHSPYSTGKWAMDIANNALKEFKDE